MYFNIFWKSSNRPSNGRECLLYWYCSHLVVEISSFTFKQPKSASRHYPLRMQRHIGTRQWSYLRKSTDYENSPTSGSKIQNRVITGHSLQHRKNGQLLSTSWKFWGHSDIAHCGYWRGIRSHGITKSQYTMTCSIIQMALCKLSLRSTLNGRKTCSSPWR
jgi:hypothetical protein